MFCKNCGTEVKAEAAFCPNCGSPVVQPAAATGNAPSGVNNSAKVNKASKPSKKMNANGKKIIGIAAVAVVVVLALLLFSKPTIDMNKYTTVEFEGYEGVGKARVTVDWDQIEEDYGDKIKVKKLTKEEKAMLGLFGADEDEIGLMYLKDCVSYSVDKRTELSNGDKINLDWEVEEEDIKKHLNVKVKASDKEYKVKELEKVDLFDPFEYITVEYSGTAPDGYANVIRDNNKEMINYINYSLESNSGLSNGDKVKVTMRMNMSENDFANKFGCLPAATEKEYEVSGLPSYIKATSEIPEDTMAKMQKQAQDIIIGTTANWDKESKLTGTEYVGNYFITPKGSSYNYNNRIYLVYKVNATITRDVKGTVSSQDVSYYYGVAFGNLMTVPKDGSVFVDLTRYDKIQGSFDKKLEFIGPDGSKSYNYYFNGYQTLDEIYNIAVIKNIESYNYEENITK